MTVFIFVVLAIVLFLAVAFVVTDWERCAWMIRCAKAEDRVKKLERQLADRSGVSA